MARLFDDALAEYLEVDTAVLTAAPFTMSLWFLTDDLSSKNVFFYLGDKDEGDEFWDAGMDDDGASSPNNIFIESDSGPGGESAKTSTGASIDTWHHACVIEASATDRSAFIDGGSKVTDSEDSDPSGADRTSIGRRGESSPGKDWSGKIAHVAVWNVALTDQEVATLAQGVSPLRVRRDALVAYWPVGGQSDEPDIVGGVNMTVNGTPAQAEEPPIPYAVVAPGN